MNPFRHGVVVSGEDFCPRPDLLKELRGHIKSRQNCVIRGGRRMGKTSAVLEAIRLQRNAGEVVVNCWGKSSLRSFAESISEAFLTYQSRRGLSLTRILSGFAHLRPQASIDPHTGLPSFSVDFSGSLEMTPRSLERVLDPIGKEGKKRPLVVVFDEFQALMQLEDGEEVMASLRGAIQLQPEVTYFILGSIRNLMDGLFNDPGKPFFKSAAAVSVGPIDRSDYISYLDRKFQKGGRSVTEDAFEKIFDLANDITGDVQQLCAQVWNVTDSGSKVGPDEVARALGRIHETESESNARIIDLLTPGQVRVLWGIAKVGGAQPTSQKFLEASGVRQPSSVTKALKRLEKEGLIFRDANGYHFFSPFFRTWMLNQDLGP
jgi:hypothetical protein